MNWIADILSPERRTWEEFYRNRWQHDKVVRSTHDVNCTGGCSWNVFVKDGIVTWETQTLDYPALQAGLPPYEPRGCQRGIAFSRYIYSPLRVNYPYAPPVRPRRSTGLRRWRGRASAGRAALPAGAADRGDHRSAKPSGRDRPGPAAPTEAGVLRCRVPWGGRSWP